MLVLIVMSVFLWAAEGVSLDCPLERFADAENSRSTDEPENKAPSFTNPTRQSEIDPQSPAPEPSIAHHTPSPHSQKRDFLLPPALFFNPPKSEGSAQRLKMDDSFSLGAPRVDLPSLRTQRERSERGGSRRNSSRDLSEASDPKEVASSPVKTPQFAPEKFSGIDKTKAAAVIPSSIPSAFNPPKQVTYYYYKAEKEPKKKVDWKLEAKTDPGEKITEGKEGEKPIERRVLKESVGKEWAARGISIRKVHRNRGELQKDEIHLPPKADRAVSRLFSDRAPNPNRGPMIFDRWERVAKDVLLEKVGNRTPH